MPTPEQEMQRLQELREKARMAELRAKGPPQAKVIKMPTQHIEGEVPEPGAFESGGVVGNAVNQLARGATMGAAPYLEAGYRKLTQGGDYGQHLSDIRGGLAEGEENHPISSMAAQGAGAMATGMAGAASLPARAATAAPATAWTGVAPKAALGAAEGGVTAAFESGGDPVKTAQGAVMGGTLAGRGAGLMQTAAKREAQKRAAEISKRAAAEAPAPPVVDSLREGARRTAKVASEKVIPAAGAAYLASQFDMPKLATGIVAGVAAPYAYKAAKTAGKAGAQLADAGLEKAGTAIAPAAAQTVASQTDSYDPRLMASIQSQREGARKKQGIDNVRKAFVDGRMSPELRGLMQGTIEDGGDYKSVAAKIEEAQANPGLARELAGYLGHRVEGD